MLHIINCMVQSLDLVVHGVIRVTRKVDKRDLAGTADWWVGEEDRWRGMRVWVEEGGGNRWWKGKDRDMGVGGGIEEGRETGNWEKESRRPLGGIEEEGGGMW